MATKKKRIAISFDDKQLQQLMKLTAELHKSKTEVVVDLLNKKGRPTIKYREVDTEKINACLVELQNIDNQLRGIANNINQYQHTINQYTAAGKVDAAAKMAAFQPLQWSKIPEIHDLLQKTIKELTKDVNY